MKRPLVSKDLEDKGYPFECLNCGNKPTPLQVIDHHGVCEICEDVITTYTIDAAKLLIEL